jgi:hypothetical protein
MSDVMRKTKVGVILDLDNFMLWHKSWTRKLRSYGLIGEEIIYNIDIRSQILKPSADAPLMEVTQVNNVPQVVQRPLTERELKQLTALQTAWDKAEALYKKEKGELFSDLIDSIDSSILPYLFNEPTYETIERDGNTRGLWNLIILTLQQNGTSQHELVERWKNLRQKSPDTHMVEELNLFINKFEAVLMLIRQTENGITPRKKAEQLVRAVDYDTYNIIVNSWLLTIDNYEVPFPEYNIIKKTLLDQDKIFKRQQVDRGFVSKVSTSSSTKFSDNKNSISEDICYKCGKVGHRRFECKGQPVYCEKCGGQHPTKCHDKVSNSEHSSQTSNSYSKSSKQIKRGRSPSPKSGYSDKTFSVNAKNYKSDQIKFPEQKKVRFNPKEFSTKSYKSTTKSNKSSHKAYLINLKSQLEEQISQYSDDESQSQEEESEVDEMD